MSHRQRIYLVRHAEGEHNVDAESASACAIFADVGSYTIPDPVLTELGLQQATQLGQRHSKLMDEIDLIVSSPLKRCIATAHRAYGPALDRGVPMLLLPELQEISATKADTGSHVDELRAHAFEREVDPEQFDNLPADWCSKRGRWSPSSAAVRDRAKWVRRWLRDRPERTIIVVSHGSYITVLASASGWKRYANAAAFEYRFRNETDEDAKLEPFDSTKSPRRFSLRSDTWRNGKRSSDPPAAVA